MFIIKYLYSFPGTVFASIVFASFAWINFSLASPLPTGRSIQEITINGTTLSVHTYKPTRWNQGPLLISFHGLSRNMEAYMDAAQPLADQQGLLLVTPLFDRERFPYWRYQALGISRNNRRITEGAIPVEPENQWTSALVLGLIDHVRRIEMSPASPYYLMGHSAGGQIANRIAAFASHEARRIVVTNPSSWVMPVTTARFPYGFGDLPAVLQSEARLKRYLASPLTVFLGTADLLDKDLDMNAPAMLQGRTRYERGRNAYTTAERIARERGWPFGWKLVEVEGIGHNAAGMYGGPQAVIALGLNIKK